MKVKTSKLSGAALDWAVAKCENLEIHALEEGMKVAVRNGEWEPWWVFTPTSSWAQGGPIIEREGVAVDRHPGCESWVSGINGRLYIGTTPLIAAMRCYVTFKMGDEVEIPEELIK